MSLLHDLRHSGRVLRTNPAYALSAILVLALGIGANTAIFSLVNAVLIRPLPFRDAGRLVFIWHVPPEKQFPGVTQFAVSPANYLDWKAQSRSFEGMAIFGIGQLTVTDAGEPQSFQVANVSADFFPTLGVQPALGRGFTAADDEAGAGQVMLLSDAVWRTRFGGDHGIIGRQVRANQQTYTVIGVMGPELDFPFQSQLWTPLAWDAKAKAVRGIHDNLVLARLKPGVSLQQANAEMQGISEVLAKAYPKEDAGWGATVHTLRDDLVGSTKLALLVLLGAVAFVLLIACANVANLSLARTLALQKEIAIRAALGARRGRLVAQRVGETLFVAILGGAVAIALAAASMNLIVKLLSAAITLPKVTLDARVLGFAVLISLLAGLLAGLGPALGITRRLPALNDALKEGMGRGGSGSGGRRTRSALVTAEVALSLILLAGAGMMIRSLWQLQAVKTGFDKQNLITFSVSLPGQDTPAQRAQFFAAALQRVRALPGVIAAGAIDGLPTQGGAIQPVAIEGRPTVSAAEQPEVAIRRATPGYLEAMRIPLLRGRNISEADVAGSPPVILISQATAREFFAQQDPIGRHITLTFEPGVAREIVGVVGDVKLANLNSSTPETAIYAPLAQLPRGNMNFTVRSALPPATMTGALTAAVHEVDRELPITNLLTMQELMEQSFAPQRFSMQLLVAFAALAVVLATVGIYGVLAYIVRRRTREVGIRMALGARIGDVLGMMLLEGMKPTLAGIGLGLVGALLLRRVGSGLVFGVSPSDPLTLGAVSALLALVALGACVAPAYRATRVDPLNALREE